MKGINLNTVLIVAVAVLLTIQLQTCFAPGKKPPDISGEIKAKDDLIEVLQRGRLEDRRLLDSALTALSSLDAAKVTEYKTTVVKYEKIPVYINSLGRDSLRAAVENF